VVSARRLGLALTRSPATAPELAATLMLYCTAFDIPPSA
jgi:hypothetical protein